MEHLSHPRVVGVEHTLSGYAALCVAVALAHSRQVPLQAICASTAFGLADVESIDRAFHEALAGYPLDLEISKTVTHTLPSTALAENATDPRDLIVVGNDGRGARRAFWSGSSARNLFKHARCQILVVPGPEMHQATRRSLRRLCRARACVGPFRDRGAAVARPPLPGLSGHFRGRVARVHALECHSIGSATGSRRPAW